MYSAIGSTSEYRDGIFSKATPSQAYQSSQRQYTDGSLGHVFRDGVLGAVRPMFSALQIAQMQERLRRGKEPAKIGPAGTGLRKAVQGFGETEETGTGINWPILIGGAAALTVALVVMTSKPSRRRA